MTDLPNPFTQSSPSTGGSQEAPAVAVSPAVAAGLLNDDHRFVLDEAAFMEAIEPLPLFLQAPLDVLNALAGYAR